MDRFERIKKTLQSQPVDRVPASFWFHFPPDQLGGHAMAQAHLAYYRRAGQDFLKVMNDNGFAMVGVDSIQSAEDWGKLRPAPLNSRPYQVQLDGLKEILDEVGSEVPVITTVFAPFPAAAYNRNGMLDYTSDSGQERFTRELRAAPGAAESALKAVADSLAVFVRACIEAGAAGIYLSVKGSERSRFTPAEFEHWIRPGDLMVLNAAIEAGAWFNLLHMCGDNLRLENYSDYPAHVFNWAAEKGNISITEGHALFQKPVAGGMGERGIIVNGTRPQIQEEVKKVLAAAGETGFMLGAGCTLPNDIDVQHIIWAQQATSRG